MPDFEYMAILIHIHGHQKDDDFETALTSQMQVFVRNNTITLSQSSKVNAGESTHDIILENINRAEILVLLISVDFLVEEKYFESDYTSYYESFKGNKALIPVYCRACNWKQVPEFSGLKCTPSNENPIGRPLETKDKIFLEVSQDINVIAARIRRENQDKEEMAQSIHVRNSELEDRIDTAFKQNNIYALKNITEELSEPDDYDTIREIEEYIEILKIQSESL